MTFYRSTPFYVVLSVFVVFTLIAVVGVFGAFTSSFTQNQTITAGVVDICGSNDQSCNPTVNALTVDAYGLAPGQPVERFFALENNGTLGISDVTAHVNATGTLSNIATNVTLRIERCSAGYNKTNNACTGSWGVVAGWDNIDVGNVDAVGETRSLQATNMAAGTAIGYRITVTPKASVGNADQGATLNLAWVFTAQSRSGYTDDGRVTVTGAASDEIITVGGEMYRVVTWLNNNGSSLEPDGSITVADGSVDVEYLIVAGGGGGGASALGGTARGGGGAGGLLTNVGGSLQTVSAVQTVTVGAGGTGSVAASGANGTSATNGGNSSIGSLVAAVGGGSGPSTFNTNGATGGSGGGGSNATGVGGAGTSGQGNAGGNGAANVGAWASGGGGGGAGQAGSNGTQNQGGNGGNGLSNTITGSSVTYAGGGGGAEGAATAGAGGSGGGGAGFAASTAGTATSGTDGLGGGGGGAGGSGSAAKAGGDGGDGLVIVRWRV